MLNQIVAAVNQATVKIDNILEAKSVKRQEIAESFVATLQPNALGNVPTVDNLGRLHAPVGGWVISNDLGETSYIGGEFLPYLETDTAMAEWERASSDFFPSKFTYKLRVLVATSEYSELVSSLNPKYVTISGTGKTWVNNEGVEQHYVYLETFYKSLYNSIQEILENERKAKEAAWAKEKEALGEVAIEGKHTVEGTVVKIADVECVYQGMRSVLYVKLESGCLVIGTLPKSLYGVEVGSKVQFSATFSKHKSDKTISYYKRPTKAVIV